MIRQVSSRKRDSTTDRNLSVAVMGLKDVGKTSIIEHLVERYDSEASGGLQNKKKDYHTVTVCDLVMDFYESKCTMAQGYPLTDISHILKSTAFIIVFTVNRLCSYEYAEQLKDTINDIKGGDVPMVVVGNKHDVTQREVGFALTDCVVSMDWELPYTEVSTKTGYNLNLILPYLFRHESLSRYRHYFTLDTSKSERGRSMSAGCLTSGDFCKAPDSKAQRPRASTVSAGSPYCRGIRKERDEPKRRGSLTKSSFRSYLVNMFAACKDAEQDEKDSTLILPDAGWRKRSHSLSTISEDDCELSVISRASRETRRMSVAGHRQLSDKQININLVAPRKYESWLSAIRKHFKMDS